MREEAAWQSGVYLRDLLNHLCYEREVHQTKAGQRRLRLFGCAGCRAIMEHIPPGPCRRAVEVAEAYAEGRAKKEDLEAARAACNPFLSRAGAGPAELHAFAGVGVREEGAVVVRDCRIHGHAGNAGLLAVEGGMAEASGCEMWGNRNGAKVSASEATLAGCRLHGNTGDGVLVEAEGRVTASDCRVVGNGGYGVNGAATLTGCDLSGNALGERR